MTIPSSLLIQEIMHYEGYSPKPELNRVGMPSIGYGFPLWEEALDILHGNTKLARSIKNCMPKEMENAGLAVQRLLQLPLAVTEEKARALLEQSLLYYAEELGRKYAGFRHLVNICGQCGNAVIYPQSSFAEYEMQLTMQNYYRQEKKVKQEGASSVSQNQEPFYFSKPNGTRHNGSLLNGTAGALHPAFLQSFYSSSEAFAGANPFSQYKFFPAHKKQTKHKKGRFMSYLALTDEEQALLRVDSVLFVTHLLGLEITLQMHDFFLALQQDNYAEAANQLLSHGTAASLGAVMAILARRIREASLDFQDLAMQKAETPKMHFHRKKMKNYFMHYVQNRKKYFGQTEHCQAKPSTFEQLGKQSGEHPEEQPGACYA